MITYYYQFDLTSSSISIPTSGSVSDEGYDLTEFNADSRGTPRVADWSDISSMTEAEYDIFLEALGLDNVDQTFFVSWNSRSSSYQNRNQYWWYGNSIARPFWARINPSSPGGWHQQNNITSEKEIVLGSWSPASLRSLVFFPDYEANGGRQTMTVSFASQDPSTEDFCFLNGSGALRQSDNMNLYIDGTYEATWNKYNNKTVYYNSAAIMYAFWDDDDEWKVTDQNPNLYLAQGDELETGHYMAQTISGSNNPANDTWIEVVRGTYVSGAEGSCS
jgi:hypothetical protein